MTSLLRGLSMTAAKGSLFLILALVLVGQVVFWRIGVLGPRFSATEAAGDGPVAENDSPDIVFPLVSAIATSGSTTLPGVNYSFPDNSLALASQEPLINVLVPRSGLKKYKVRPGDTLPVLAARFGISPETIIWANAGSAAALKAGRTLIILPVSGILYETNGKETMETVAGRYGISPASIEQYNPDYQRLFNSSKQTVVLPFAKPL